MRGLTHPKFFPDTSKIHPWFQPALAGLLCGIVGMFIPQVTGLGTETIQNILSGDVLPNIAAQFLISKLLLTIICLRLGLIGGVFAPALFLGACSGILLGTFFNTMIPDTNIELFAVAAMAAVGSCVIGGPLANMMIVFELTSNYQATLAAGISIVFASLVSSKIIGQLLSYKLFKGSIHDHASTKRCAFARIFLYRQWLETMSPMTKALKSIHQYHWLRT